MCSQLKSLSVMGISNSEILLSEKDLKLKILVRKQALQFEEKEQLQEQEEAQEIKEEGKCKLKIKLPTSEEFKINQDKKQDEDVNDGGFKTPTSLEKRIPIVLPCPPAPRKPKSQPCPKRKLMPAGRRVLLDLSNEIESLFPPSVVGSKMKKVRQQNGTK